MTDLLVRWSEGDPSALEELMPLVGGELRRLAGRFFAGEPQDHTLQPTALVNELYLKLVDQKRVSWQNRKQFFAFAPVLMRRILVDHARARMAQKRGAQFEMVPLEDAAEIPRIDAPRLVELDRALDELARVSPRQARLVELRFFGGLTIEEAAEVLDMGRATAKRDWATAKLFLYRALEGDPPEDED